MHIYIDGDGCPVVDITLDIAKRYSIPVTIVCDTAHEFRGRGAKVITVEKGADSADLALANKITSGDIAVTHDYGLAALCLARNAYAINPNGIIYDSNNIDGLLLNRYIGQKLKRNGKYIKGPKKRTPQQQKSFASSLSELLDKLTKDGDDQCL